MNHNTDEIDLNIIEESDDEEVSLRNNKSSNLNYCYFANFKNATNQANNVPRVAHNRNLTFNPQMTLKSVDLIPAAYRNIFASFPYFNHVQSTVFDDAVYTDKNLVISAPTSSGKTVLLELAIVRLMSSLNYSRANSSRLKFKIIYMAPLKALCSEKHKEWCEKFEKLHGLKCIELTGDSDTDNENEIDAAHIICTTPEKWDSMTRKWKNRHLIMSRVRLMLIDEIHVLGESSRGAKIEAVISRMKLFSLTENSSMIRFIAISATIPNVDDIASWLSSDFSTPATVYKLNESFRPVSLNKIVIGYKCEPKQTDFKFDMSLNYKLSHIIDEYSHGKPALIFCSTRKITVQAAQVLANTTKYISNKQHEQLLKQTSQKLKDPVLREIIASNGIGFHHAGLETSDRSLIENLFLNGHLLVLYSTSTLAIGINLPAHLVVIKSTMYYSNQNMIEYSTSQILQMIGRAGRPQVTKITFFSRKLKM